VSTRVEGAAAPVILVTARATFAAGDASLLLTVIEESTHLYRYNLAEKENNRVAYGKIFVPDYMTALRRAAEICAEGFQPASIERGLLDEFAHQDD
jgi:hypothetical protein